CLIFLFFFQAEDGIRDATVTGVQTCALPIFSRAVWLLPGRAQILRRVFPLVQSRASSQRLGISNTVRRALWAGRKTTGTQGGGAQRSLREKPSALCPWPAKTSSITDCGVDQQTQRHPSNRERIGRQFLDHGGRAKKRLPQLPYNERSAIEHRSG